MTAGEVWRSFGRWRRRRPFWGCLFLLLSGAEMFYTANASLSGLSVHLGPTGFLSYLLPLILVASSLLCLFTPAQRIFYGIVGLLAALYSFIGLNLGGFFIGMLFGIIGGALVIAWGPPRPRKVNPEFVPIADQMAAGEPAEASDQETEGVPEDQEEFPAEHQGFPAEHQGFPAERREFAAEYEGFPAAGEALAGTAEGLPGEPAEPAGEPAEATAETENLEIAGHDDRPTREQLRPATAQESGIVPGFDDQEPPKSGSARSRLAKNPRALTVALLVIGLTAGVLAIGSRVPASAQDCPAGMPSRSTSATASSTAADRAAAGRAAARAGSKSSSSPKGGSASSKGGSAAGATPKGGSAPKGGSTSRGGSASKGGGRTATPAPGKSGGTIVDGVKGILDGVGNLLGLGDGQSSAPSGSPSPSQTPTTGPTRTGDPEPTTTGAPEPSGTGLPPTSSPGSATASGSSSASPSVSPSASASDDDIPCLGPRVFGLKANADGVPLVADKAGLLETDSLTMYDSTYDGVVNLPTGSGGSARVLKFSMDRAVNKPFRLTIDEKSGAQTVITSNELATVGNVKFYSERIEGRLFGLIPVVFTPDQPPPLTLPILWFTDVKIQLNYISCDQLTGTPLHINES